MKTNSYVKSQIAVKSWCDFILNTINEYSPVNYYEIFVNPKIKDKADELKEFVDFDEFIKQSSQNYVFLPDWLSDKVGKDWPLALDIFDILCGNTSKDSISLRDMIYRIND